MKKEFCEKSLWKMYKVLIFFSLLYFLCRFDKNVIEVWLCKIRLENILNHRKAN